jgi:hypothetical protein
MPSYTQTSFSSTHAIASVSSVLKRSCIKGEMEYARQSRDSSAPVISVFHVLGYNYPRYRHHSLFGPLGTKAQKLIFKEWENIVVEVKDEKPTNEFGSEKVQVWGEGNLGISRWGYLG